MVGIGVRAINELAHLSGCPNKLHVFGPGSIKQEIAETTEWFSVVSVPSVHKESSTHALFSQASEMTHDVINAAIEVHKDKGAGLLESIYEWCLTMGAT